MNTKRSIVQPTACVCGEGERGREREREREREKVKSMVLLHSPSPFGYTVPTCVQNNLTESFEKGQVAL